MSPWSCASDFTGANEKGGRGTAARGNRIWQALLLLDPPPPAASLPPFLPCPHSALLHPLSPPPTALHALAASQYPNKCAGKLQPFHQCSNSAHCWGVLWAAFQQLVLMHCAQDPVAHCLPLHISSSTTIPFSFLTSGRWGRSAGSWSCRQGPLPM